jgi:hypothetical protein
MLILEGLGPLLRMMSGSRGWGTGPLLLMDGGQIALLVGVHTLYNVCEFRDQVHVCLVIYP